MYEDGDLDFVCSYGKFKRDITPLCFSRGPSLLVVVHTYRPFHPPNMFDEVGTYRLELAVLEYDIALVLALEHFVVPFFNCGSGGRDLYIIITGAANGNIALWDVTNLVQDNCNFNGLDVGKTPVAPLRPLTGRGSQGGRSWMKTSEQSSASLNSKLSEGGSIWKGKALDPLGPVFGAGGEVENPDEENADGASKSSIVQPSENPTETKPSVKLNPVLELNAAHQSGINCVTVARIQRAGNSSSNKMVYLVISGGDDQALHVATFLFEMNYSNDFGNPQRREVEHCSAPMIPPVFRCLCKSLVPRAHNSSVKGVWTDGLWAFSAGLDQRLRCWRVNADAACSELPVDLCDSNGSRLSKAPSPLVECLTCVTDVPEPASLHVKHFYGGFYEIAVVGRGLQVIKFDSSCLSCQPLQS